MPTTAPSGFVDVHVSRDPADRCFVYEHGWQSWSPAGLYPADLAASPRPHRPIWQTMAFRPEAPAPAAGFQGEGLLVLVNEDRTVEVFLAPDPTVAVASIRAHVRDGRVVVSAFGEVAQVSAPSLDAGLAEAARRFASVAGVAAVGSLPAGWCSWYTYWNTVTEQDIADNLTAMERHDLPIEVVQVDDGYQAGIGDWLDDRPGYGSLARTVRRILDAGRTPGLWTAPFCVGSDSRLAQDHADWLVDAAVASERHWDQEIRVLDVTHPEAAEHLVGVFAALRDLGIRFHKVDFVYAGAMEGRRHADASGIDAYRRGLELIREGAGSDAVILGCGAPLLPSVGLVDAMRISPDVMPAWEPPLGDISQPGMRSALAAGRARAWMHGRLWVNDPDCVLVRPDVERPEPWREYVHTLGGLAVSSDPLPDLGPADVAETRALMIPSGTAAMTWDPWAGPDQGVIHRSPASA